MNDEYSLLNEKRDEKRAYSCFKVVTTGSLLALVAAVVIGVVISTQVAKLPKAPKGAPVDIPVVNPTWKRECDAFKNQAAFKTPEVQSRGYIIKNATIWTGIGTTYHNKDIMLDTNGKIKAVGNESLAPPSGDWLVIDAHGAWVTPGLFDLHSHAGVYSFPGDARANQDGNEMTNPTSPAVRAIDAFDPEDPAIALIRESGVTSSQILPGSGNVMGGQAFAAKFRGKTVKDMAIVGAPVALKFACGENPKNTYGGRGVAPSSRMGIGYVMRTAFAAAQELLQKKQDYCASPQSGLMPKNLAWDNLVALLQKRAVLNVHCYKVVDFEMAMRVAKEYNVQIAAFHHAIEAYRIPKELAEANIAVALFSDNRGFKFEAFKDSVYAPRILDEAGVRVIMKTDHPVLFGWELLPQAQRAAHWGLSNEAALRSVTAYPAAAAGFGDSFGTLEVGKDSDLVIWDRHPLQFGARPQSVFIDGTQVFHNPLARLRTDKLTYTSPYRTWKMTTTPSGICSTAAGDGDSLANYAVINANIMTGVAGSGTITNGVLVVTAGNVSCVGTAAECSVPGGYPTFDIKGGVVTPGFINVGISLGNVEVEQEGRWQDGSITGGASVSTLGGVQLETTHIRNAWADGILVSVSRPVSANVEMGSASSFYIGPGIDFMQDASGHSYLIKEFTSVDMQIGNSAKSRVASVSEQISQLKSIKWDSGVWQKVASGEMPLVFWVNSADYMLAILRALETSGLQKGGNVKIVFGGAAEAHKIVAQLKQWNVSIVYRRCAPEGYETRRCHNEVALPLFRANGIKVGLAQSVDSDMSRIRGLRWNAGLLVENGYTPAEALATATSNLASIFNLPNGVGSIVADTPANWVAFNGNPLDTTSIIEVLGVNGKIICKPEQD